MILSDKILGRSTCTNFRHGFKSHEIPTRKPLKVNFCLSKVNAGTIDDLKLDSKAINVNFIAKSYNLVGNKKQEK